MPNKSVLAAGQLLPAPSSPPSPFPTTCAPTARVVADPLLEAINDYRRGVVEHSAIPHELITNENEDELVEATYGSHQRRLTTWDQPAMTREGAIEALRLMESEDVFLDDIGVAMHRAVLRYLEAL